jgi:hypothetical protein
MTSDPLLLGMVYQSLRAWLTSNNDKLLISALQTSVGQVKIKEPKTQRLSLSEVLKNTTCC